MILKAFAAAACIAFAVWLILSGGCAIVKEFEIESEGYFEYIVMGEDSRFPTLGDKGVAAIVGLTESGMEQQTLDIPRQLGGRPVRYLGYKDEVTRTDYYVWGPDLKKVYIHDNIEFIQNLGAPDLDRQHAVDIIICSANENLSVYLSAVVNNIYYYGDLIDS